MQKEKAILNRKIIPLFIGLLLLGGGLFLVPFLSEYSLRHCVIFLPYVIYVIFIIIAISVFKLFRFRGDYLILIFYFILCAIGLLYQLRLEYITNEFQYEGIEANVQSSQSTVTSAELSIHSVKFPKFFWTTLTGGVLLLTIALVFNDKRMAYFGRKYYVLYFITILFLIVTVIISNIDKSGKFFFYRTPWELVKVTLTLTLAGFFTENYQLLKKGKFGIPWPSVYAFGPLIFMLLIPFFLFVSIGDYGQLIIYTGFIVFFLFASTNKIGYLIIGVAGIILMPKIILIIKQVFPDYAIQRIENWQNIWLGFPSAEWWDRNYQVLNSIFAIKAGNITGTGLGMGFPKLVSLVKSDFIFAGFTEEFGLIGSFLLLLIYFLLFVQLLKVSFSNRTRFLKLFGIGLTLMLAFQVFINIGGVINLIPLTGITLPFLSRGGFSFITSSIIIGILLAISQGENKSGKRHTKTASNSQRRNS